MEEHKECSDCKEEKPVTLFYKDSRGKKGVTSRCKKCASKRSRDSYWKDPEKHREGKRKYYQENTESVTESNHRWAQANKERVREVKRKWRRDNPEKSREIARKCRAGRIDKAREYNREWRKENPEKMRLYKQIRRAKEAELPSDLTIQEQEYANYFFGATCALSGSTEDIQFDHVIPISIGHGGTTLQNMIPLSGMLNQSKNSRNIFEWFSENKERFGLPQYKFDILIEYLSERNQMTTQEYREYVYSCYEEVLT